MSPILERVDIKEKPKLGGGGPGKIPHRRGYGGDDGDHDRSDDFLSRDRLRRFRIGIAAGIVSVGVLFVGLTTVYIWRQSTGGRWDSEMHVNIPDWHPLTLPYRLLFINTFALLLSSLTLELARRGVLKKTEFTSLGIRAPRLQTELPWLGITVLLGFGFLAGQLMVWNLFRHQGIYLASYPSGSFFYLLTGLHAVHLLGGLIALLYTLAGSWMKMKLDAQRIAVDITGWYWHFMALLWIYIFALLHFAKGGT